MPPVDFEIKDAVGIIRLNRPEKYNAFNQEMALLMQEKLDECKSPGVRCVYITGTGKAFSSGQDLEEVVSPGGPDVTKILTDHYNPIIKRIRRLQKPVIAAINGVAAGAGANIAVCCDIVVAARSASFMQAFSKIGLIPDSGGTYFLPRLIGWQRASALMMLSEKISADEAEKIGMVYRVFEDSIFTEESLKIATALASMPTRALALTKELLDNSFNNDYEEQLHDEELFQEKAERTADYKEGVQAFMEKRKPNFTGE